MKPYFHLAHPDDMRPGGNRISVLVAARCDFQDSAPLDHTRLAREVALAPCMADFVRLIGENPDIKLGDLRPHWRWIMDVLHGHTSLPLDADAARAAGWIA